MKLTNRTLEIFNNKILPNLKEIEDFRLQSLKKHKLRMNIMGYVAILFFISEIMIIGYCLFNDISLEALPAIPFVIAIAYLVYAVQPSMKYTKKVTELYKQKFMPSFFKEVFNFEYKDTNYRESLIDEIKKSNAIHEVTKVLKADDYFCGTILDDVKFEYIDVDLEGFYTKKAHETFRGEVVVLTMPFEFKEHVVLTSFRHSNINKEDNLEYVKINNELLKNYSILSRNSHDAFYILSPGFINNVVKAGLYLDKLSYHSLTWFKNSKKTEEEYTKDRQSYIDRVNFSYKEHINLEFKGNKVYIFLNTFESDSLTSGDINTSAYSTEPAAIIEHKINALVQLAQYLKLDYLKDRKQAVNNLNK